MLEVRPRRLAATSIGLAAVFSLNAALADHACDASLADEGWTIIPSHETVSVTNGAPYQSGNDWFVDRTTTTLPLCNYVNAAGNYSLRSYSLSPETKTERVTICKRTPGGSTPIAPYDGACPPK